MASVVVEDEGPGIAPAALAHIFDTGFTTKKDGSGVGLSVSQRVIEQHGGTIEVNSEPGRGARFTVLLPERSA